MLQPSKQHVVLKMLAEKDVLFFKKGTAYRYHTQKVAKISPPKPLVLKEKML